MCNFLVAKIYLHLFFSMFAGSHGAAKTELRAHYKSKYGMMDGGPQLFLEGARLQTIIKKYLP